jgi:hypothetical protein
MSRRARDVRMDYVGFFWNSSFFLEQFVLEQFVLEQFVLEQFTFFFLKQEVSSSGLNGKPAGTHQTKLLVQISPFFRGP